ncbi:MAG: hypothetical protein JKY25_01275 [Robiginitomaculum sp.]|nr:hypothetical protein [Robiginitomaculum sp.]
MKRFLLFALTVFVLMLLGACGNSGTKPPADQLIVGKWQATEPMVMSQSGMVVTFANLKTAYAEDRTSSSSADITLSGSMLPQTIEMSFNAEASWAIQGEQLSEIITSADIKMKEKISGMPDFGAIFAQQMQAQGTSTSTIIVLDKKTLTVQADGTGMQITMKRE